MQRRKSWLEGRRRRRGNTKEGHWLTVAARSTDADSVASRASAMQAMCFNHKIHNCHTLTATHHVSRDTRHAAHRYLRTSLRCSGENSASLIGRSRCDSFLLAKMRQWPGQFMGLRPLSPEWSTEPPQHPRWTRSRPPLTAPASFIDIPVAEESSTDANAPSATVAAGFAGTGTDAAPALAAAAATAATEVAAAFSSRVPKSVTTNLPTWEGA